MKACSDGDFEAANREIAAGADVNAKDNLGATALHYAVDQGHLEIVRLLISTPNIELDEADEDGNTPLMVALIKGHKEIAEELFFNKHHKNYRHPTQEEFDIAARSGFYEGALLLLVNGVDPNGFVHYGSVSGSLKLVANSYPQIFELLLFYGAHPLFIQERKLGLSKAISLKLEFYLALYGLISTDEVIAKESLQKIGQLLQEHEDLKKLWIQQCKILLPEFSILEKKNAAREKNQNAILEQYLFQDLRNIISDYQGIEDRHTNPRNHLLKVLIWLTANNKELKHNPKAAILIEGLETARKSTSLEFKAETGVKSSHTPAELKDDLSQFLRENPRRLGSIFSSPPMVLAAKNIQKLLQHKPVKWKAEALDGLNVYPLRGILVRHLSQLQEILSADILQKHFPEFFSAKFTIPHLSPKAARRLGPGEGKD